MARSRRAIQDELPTTPDEISLPANKNLTEIEMPFGTFKTLIYNDDYVPGKRVVMWANRKYLDALNSEKIFGDGTFRIATLGFRQVYAIHAYIHGKLFCLVWVNFFSKISLRSAYPGEILQRRNLNQAKIQPGKMSLRRNVTQV